MKKILFVATLCVAGLASANNGKVETDTKKNEVSKTSVIANEVQETGCFPFTLSCGVKGTACGDSTPDLVDMILDVDDAICGKKEV